MGVVVVPVTPVIIKGQVRGYCWGQLGENAVWLATRPRKRFIWRRHDSLFIALGRFRLRLMKPEAPWTQ